MALLKQAQGAQSQMEARQVAPKLWALWAKAPDAKAQALLNRGMELLRVSDFKGSIAVLDELVAYCPDYAEGYNQRAFANYLQQDFDAALPDLDRAQALSPNHTGVLTGKALTLIGMGRAQAAQDVLRDAVAMNPWLSERALLVEPKGEDL